MFHSPYLPFAHRLLTTPSRPALRRSRFLFSFLLFLFSVTSTNSAFAQIDTTLREYFPMHIGDYWGYREFFGDSFSVRIVGDTLLNNRRYYSFRFNNGDSWFYRIDDSMRVRGFTRDSVWCPEREFIEFNLAAPDSSIWHICLLGNENYSYNGFLRNTIEFYPNINRTLPTKKFSGAYIDRISGDTVFTNTYYPRQDLARGIGIIRFQGEAAPEYRLVGAIINGVVYGTVLSVALKEIDGEILLPRNYPNPFNSITKISFALTERNKVTVTILDLLGRRIGSVVENSYMEAGVHEIIWDAENLPSGVYIYRISTEKFSKWSKAILLK